MMMMMSNARGGVLGPFRPQRFCDVKKKTTTTLLSSSSSSFCGGGGGRPFVSTPPQKWTPLYFFNNTKVGQKRDLFFLRCQNNTLNPNGTHTTSVSLSLSFRLLFTSGRPFPTLHTSSLSFTSSSSKTTTTTTTTTNFAAAAAWWWWCFCASLKRFD